jgi:hypothetical protein
MALTSGRGSVLPASAKQVSATASTARSADGGRAPQRRRGVQPPDIGGAPLDHQCCDRLAIFIELGQLYFAHAEVIFLLVMCPKTAN